MALLFVFLQALLFLVVNCVDNDELVDGANGFGYDLTNEISADSSGNIWISPFCITSCFALIYPGSNDNTQTEIADVMRYPTDTTDPSLITQQFFTLQSLIETTYDGSHSSSIIGIANKIYSSHSLLLEQSYINALNDGTQSFIDQNFDFSSNNASSIINDWVYDQTNGLIDEIIPETQDISSWRLAALNAIYLNGTFSFQFKQSMTSFHTFYSNSLRNTELSDCHLMHQIHYFLYHSNDDYQFIKFPFSDSNDLFVLFALPKHHNTASITDANVIQTAIDNLQSTYIALALPKISISESYTLKEPLQNLGMQTSFNANADFSGISDEALFIDSVIHKTMIEMDEKGLIAAAVTLISMVKTSIDVKKKPKPILFKADHPFEMFIIDGEHEDAILFMGHIKEPGAPQGSDTPQYDESVDEIWNKLETNDRDIRERNALLAVLCAVIVVIVIVVMWCLWNKRKQKQGSAYIEKETHTKHFVELREKQAAEISKSIELGHGVTNHMDMVQNTVR